MSKEKYMEIWYVLDHSGSMQTIRDATISGFNEFIVSQQGNPGECKISLIQFDDQYEINYIGKSIHDVDEMTRDTFVPGSMTCLIGAIGRSIDELGKRLSEMSEDDRPDKVLFVVMTDGLENASHTAEWSQKYTQKKVREMVNHQRDKYNWQFVFMGANQDAYLESAKYGFTKDATTNYDATPIGTRSVFQKMSSASKEYSMGAVPVSANFFGPADES